MKDLVRLGKSGIVLRRGTVGAYETHLFGGQLWERAGKSWSKESARDLTQESANHFFTYVAKLKIGLTEIRNIPLTPLKKSMIINSMSSPLRYLLHIKESNNIICDTCSGLESDDDIDTYSDDDIGSISRVYIFD